MSKSKASSQAQQSIHQTASQMRDASVRIKKMKDVIAEVSLVQIAEMKTPFSVAQKYFEACAAISKAAVVVISEVTTNKQIREQVKTLVSNAVSDVAARTNELSNILDSAAKSKEIQVAVEEAQKGQEAFEEALLSQHRVVTKVKKARASKTSH